LIVFALAKVLLSESSAIDARGLRRVAGAAFVGSLAPVLQPLLPAGCGLHMPQVYIPVVFTLGAYAALVQWVSSERARTRRRRRPYSVLPYAAVAAVDGLLLWVSVVDRADLVAVAAAAVALTTLVATRQATALRDNARLLDRLDHLANHDPLTGVANRALVQRRLHDALADRPARPVTVALLDLDGFKEINDTLGHEAGDQLLISVAERLADCVRPGDTVARLGGDEFVVLLDGADRVTAAGFAERVVEALRLPVRAAGRDLAVRASIGIADGYGGHQPDELMRRADLAMYAAKKVPGTAYLHHEDETLPASAA
jgi:diguanylate cyclase (GGDEF)-like protein